MARDKGDLTDLQLRHWIKAGQPLAKADGDGLTFTLSAVGVAGWILRYRHGGRRRELTICRYPDIGLAEARGIATLKRAEVQQGRNPAAEKQKAKATAARDWTVRDLAKDYRAKKLVSLAHSTQVSYGRHLKRVEKKLGALTVREIEASDVVALIEGAGLTWGESNMLLITTKCLFTHACGKRLINANPFHGIMLSALLGERPPRRQRLMLTREELKLLLAAPMRRRNSLAIRILLATAVRGAELYQAKWADLDLDGTQWHIPKSKTGAAMDIPQAPVVVDWFRELRALAGAAPERHRELVPHAGPTGSARSATDAQAVHAGPAAARWQATGGEAGLACKQRPVRERVGEELERRLRGAGVNCSPERGESRGWSLPRPLGPGRHRWSGRWSGQGRSGRRLPGAHHLRLASGTGSRVAPGSGPGAAHRRR